MFHGVDERVPLAAIEFGTKVLYRLYAASPSSDCLARLSELDDVADRPTVIWEGAPRADLRLPTTAPCIATPACSHHEVR